MSVQYIAVPVDTDSDARQYRLYNTHAVGFVMKNDVVLETVNRGGGGANVQMRRTTRYVSQVSLTGANGTLSAATSGTVLAIINKNGHVTPISDPTP